MPRFLPRLAKLPLTGKLIIPPKKQQPPSFEPVSRPPPVDPSRSLLLTPGNVITNSRDYERHKTRAPVFRLRRTKTTPSDLREMTSEERLLWSNPYLRMLGSPLRLCTLSKRVLPTDLMIRMAIMRAPQTLRTVKKKSSRMLVPDGVLHPAFKSKRSTTASYMLCSRSAFSALHLPRWAFLYDAVVSPRLPEQISHHLRLRVLQEVVLLIKSLRECSGSPLPILRRLRRSEWVQLKETGILPFPGALAVVVLPPVNRDPETKQRQNSEAAMSASPLEELPRADPKREPLPLSVLYPTSAPVPLGEWPTFFPSTSPANTMPPPLAVEQVPLFNSVALFPGRTHRAKLYELFTEILGLQGKSRSSAKMTTNKGDNKASHAFLLCSSDEVDVGALGIALWRIRMWETN
ncbi:hypothetical protein MIND_00705300 [Mycena indigotica]|uniref:Uncharacterized protein n=1 Tax=Mycena indigotica TaxID=2126181 RepID=A0A8H6SL42_9AGAR|nr:uncharacterized protein MIND_00705300 [Mycena indigotica]KAF7301401.1 hypothetical protein MIND_00705300 [Mycena indigotica]